MLRLIAISVILSTSLTGASLAEAKAAYSLDQLQCQFQVANGLTENMIPAMADPQTPVLLGMSLNVIATVRVASLGDLYEASISEEVAKVEPGVRSTTKPQPLNPETKPKFTKASLSLPPKGRQVWLQAGDFRITCRLK